MPFLTSVPAIKPIDELRLYRFALPYRRPLLGENDRSGFLVCCRRGAHVGWGEISPWPGLHTQTPQMLANELPSQMAVFLQEYAPESIVEAVLPSRASAADFMDRLEATRSWLRALTPLVSWGIVSACLDLLAVENGIPPSKLFHPQAPDEVKIAGLILEAQDFSAEVYSNHVAVKVKSRHVGGDALWSKVREALPHIEIRADGNRMLSVEEAWGLCQSGRSLGIRFFEEPTAPTHLYELMQRGASIALDEYLSGPHLDPELLQNADVWVLKPSVLGPFRTFSLLHGDKPVILSSPFESAVGRRILAQLQAAFSPTEAAGLGVAAYFSRDLAMQSVAPERVSCRTSLDIDLHQLHEMGRWERT